MGRNLLTGDLSAENIDVAVFRKKHVDPVDSLRRIAVAWYAIGKTCSCGTNEACDICEIDYILEEAFDVPQKDDNR